VKLGTAHSAGIIPVPISGSAPREGALQLLINRYGKIHFAQVPERVLTKRFVVLIIGNSRVESLRRTEHL